MAATLEDALVLVAKAEAAAELGRDLALQGLYEEAIQELGKAIQLDPDFARTYVDRGDVYDYIEDFERAMDDYDKAIRLKPDYALTYLQRGLVYAKLEEWQRAMEDFDTLINLYPDATDPYDGGNLAARAHWSRSMVLGALGQHSLAEEDSRKACELDRALC